MAAIIGRKLGMTQIFDEDDGTATPVTVIEAGPCVVTAIRKSDRDGYEAVQLAGIETAERKLSKAELGHLSKADAGPMKTLVEFRDVEVSAASGEAEAPADTAAEEENPADEEAEASESTEPAESGDPEGEAPAGELKLGDKVTVAAFEAGEIVKVSAISIGKGFQGTIKRHNFSRGPVSHGSHNVRAPGSVGASADPARVFKGVKMPGRMGGKRVTQRGSRILKVDPEKNLLLVVGSIPGASNATVEVRSDG